MRRRGVFLTAGLGLVLAVGGFALGAFATAVPQVDPPSQSDSVEFWVSDPRASVDLSWHQRTSGDVVIYLSLSKLSTTMSTRVLVALECDARMRNLDYYNSYQDDYRDPDLDLDVADGSTGLGCEGGMSDDAEVTNQVFEISLAANSDMGEDSDLYDIKAIVGSPVREWTASAGGIRIARSPAVRLGDPESSLDAARDFEPPGDHSSLGVAFYATPSESVDAVIAPSGSTITQNTSMMFEDLISVSWGLEYFENARGEGDQSGMSGGFVRWVDPPTQSRASMLLLFAGVLLGVAASLVVEHLVVSRISGSPPIGSPSHEEPLPEGRTRSSAPEGDR